jgi:hypothetical protein
MGGMPFPTAKWSLLVVGTLGPAADVAVLVSTESVTPCLPANGMSIRVCFEPNDLTIRVCSEPNDLSIRACVQFKRKMEGGDWKRRYCEVILEGGEKKLKT